MDLSRRLDERRWIVQPLVVALVAAAAGGLAGGIAIAQGLPLAAIVALAPAAVIVALRSVWMGLAAVLGVAYVLPFAVIPLGGPLTPTLFESALAFCLIIAVATFVLDRRQRVHTGWAESLVLVLVGVTAFAFILGFGRGYTTQTLHDYGRFVLAIALFWVIRELMRDAASARLLLAMLLGGSAVAAAIGLALYAGGPSLTLRVLSRLIPYGYPSQEIVRFIEADPSRAMRAIGTGVDPNAFGGMMMIGFVLAASQVLSPNRAISNWLAVPAAGLSGLALLLTYSRGAWVGAAFGIAFVLLFRRRWLIAPLAGAAAIAILLGLGSGFVTRLWQGFTLQDRATRLRLREYQNAWEIIQEHPWFGVGFGDAPSVDLQTGVSSVYLLIAERIGLVGLAVFLAIAAVIACRGLSQLPGKTGWDVDILLGFEAVLLALLAVAFVDHYFFNPEFSHMVALFWIIAGAIVAQSAVLAASSGSDGVSSAAEQEASAAPRGTTAGGL